LSLIEAWHEHVNGNAPIFFGTEYKFYWSANTICCWCHDDCRPTIRLAAGDGNVEPGNVGLDSFRGIRNRWMGSILYIGPKVAQ
jgi:hypothetical protein